MAMVVNWISVQLRIAPKTPKPRKVQLFYKELKKLVSFYNTIILNSINLILQWLSTQVKVPQPLSLQ